MLPNKNLVYYWRAVLGKLFTEKNKEPDGEPMTFQTILRTPSCKCSIIIKTQITFNLYFRIIINLTVVSADEKEGIKSGPLW